MKLLFVGGIMSKKRIYNGKNQIIGTYTLFDEMNDITLAYNLGDLTNEELKQVSACYIIRWEK